MLKIDRFMGHVYIRHNLSKLYHILKDGMSMIFVLNIELKNIFKIIMWYWKHPSYHIFWKHQKRVHTPSNKLQEIVDIFLGVH